MSRILARARAKGLGLENDEEILVEATEEETLDGSETAEAAEIEATEAEEEVTEAEEQVEELEDASEALESYIDAMEEAVQKGGLSRQAALFMSMGVESVCERVGIETIPVASLESFGGDTDRVQATTVSLEGLKETLQKIWAKIKEVIRKVRTAVMGWWKKLTSWSPLLKKRAEALKKKAEKASGEAKEKEIEVSGIRNMYTGTAGKVDIKKITQVLGGATKEAVKDVSGEVIPALDALAKALEAAAKLNAEQTISGKENVSKLIVGSEYNQAVPRFGQGAYGTVSEELPGGVVFYSIAHKDGDKIKPQTIRAGLAPARSGGDKVEDKGKVPTLSLSDIKTVAQAVAMLAADAVKVADEQTKIQRAVDKVIAAGDKVSINSGSFEGDKAEEATKAVRELVQVANNCSKSSAYGIETMISHNFKVARAALNYAAKSLKQYDSND